MGLFGCYPCASVEPRSLPLSVRLPHPGLLQFCVRRLHVDPSASEQSDQPSFTIGSATHKDVPLAIQAHVSHGLATSTLLASSNRSSSAATGATLAPAAVLPLENSPSGGGTSIWRLESGASDMGLSSLIVVFRPPFSATFSLTQRFWRHQIRPL